MVRIHQEIKSIADLPNAMILLLESLRMDCGDAADFMQTSTKCKLLNF